MNEINHVPDPTPISSNNLEQTTVNGVMADCHGQGCRTNLMEQIMENNTQALINERAIIQEDLERRKKQETIKNELKLRGFCETYFNNNNMSPASNIGNEFSHIINPAYNM